MPETTGMPAAGQEADTGAPPFPPLDQLKAELRAQRKIWAAQKTAGERFCVPRAGRPVDVLLYRPKKAPADPLPVVFNMHGGAWIGGDAVLLESLCTFLAEQLPALVVNINYTKADVQPFPYADEEICGCVRYFAAHAAQYGIDPARMALLGHSAGAHLAAGAAMLLRGMQPPLAAQVLVYPAVDMGSDAPGSDPNIAPLLRLIFPNHDELTPLASPLRAPDDELRGLPPAMILVCGKDGLRGQGLAYAGRLQKLGVPVQLREYPNAVHGFIEVNRPDYPADERQTPEQAAMCRDAEQWLADGMRALLA